VHPTGKIKLIHRFTFTGHFPVHYKCS